MCACAKGGRGVTVTPTFLQTAALFYVLRRFPGGFTCFTMAGKFEGKRKMNRLPSVRALAIQKVRKCVFITWGGADCKQSGCKFV